MDAWMNRRVVKGIILSKKLIALENIDLQVMNQDLKRDLHQIIDAIDDEQTLSILKEDLAAYTLQENTDGLNPEQLDELDRAIEEADNKIELQDWQSFKSELANKWKEE